MQLREKVKAEIETRLGEFLPQALETTWDVDAVLVMIESIAFKPESGFKGDWQFHTNLQGVIRAELKSDHVDDLNAQRLIASLAKIPLFVSFPESAEAGAHEVKARLVLLDWRDALRNQMIVSALRFEVKGTLGEFSPDPGRVSGEITVKEFKPTIIDGGAA